jgi:deoxyribonuclease V
MWPATAEELIRAQAELGRAAPPPWLPEAPPRAVAGCFACFARSAAGEIGFAGAALLVEGALVATAVASGPAPAGYEPGLLALREGPLLEAAVRRLPARPEALLVNASGRDHPRRAGLALHLGAVLGIPTAGVTHRPLLAAGAEPGRERGARSPLLLDGRLVGYWLRTERGARPLAVHAAWRTDAETAAALVLAASGRFRTPEPLRRAREAARRARAG